MNSGQSIGSVGVILDYFSTPFEDAHSPMEIICLQLII
jgi:hypothetical protein